MKKKIESKNYNVGIIIDWLKSVMIAICQHGKGKFQH